MNYADVDLRVVALHSIRMEMLNYLRDVREGREDIHSFGAVLGARSLAVRMGVLHGDDLRRINRRFSRVIRVSVQRKRAIRAGVGGDA